MVSHIKNRMIDQILESLIKYHIDRIQFGPVKKIYGYKFK